MVIHIDSARSYAVVTGDVIGSSDLSGEARRRLHAVMVQGSRALRAAFGEFLPLEVDIFRGDSWQMLVSSPEKSLRLGLLYRLHLKTALDGAVDSRMAVGLGAVSFVPGDRAGEGEGPAFRLSGRALERMPAYTAMWLEADQDQDLDCELLRSAVILLDALAGEWTAKRALAVYGALHDMRQQDIARLWDPPITQQTVAEYLTRARWQSVRQFLLLFEHRVSCR
ncbi:MAG: hypothetical protein K9K39_01820 [Desulfohalobiaceae bacterium]|nr:hypothetical protein [Desulfohalobiaceae bacterium]